MTFIRIEIQTKKKCEIIIFMRTLVISMYFSFAVRILYPAPAYGLSRMMKHHVRLVIFLRDLRIKTASAFVFISFGRCHA